MIRWIKLVNDTCVAVDQLGCAGAVAVYLDAWHRDLPEFLQLRTSRDDRMKAHDVFPGVCYRICSGGWQGKPGPALVYDVPHDILTVKGYSLEDSHGAEWERHTGTAYRTAR